ncbi:hypothetical protein HA1_02512 [Clostridium perfringens F262]|uniref:O-antigen ligase-related domain-containing protein n=1 Tax=Clostridium perfringens F262 TaxID=883064 RepID=A0AAV3FFY8_CLOPF|nr:hypothetical protein HA1_02512 [Clostridium perfringens F262]
MKNSNIKVYLLYILYFFSCFFIVSINVEVSDSLKIYSGFFVSVVIIFISIFKILFLDKKIIIRRTDFILFLIVIMYSIYSLILTLYLRSDLLYTIQIISPILCIIFLNYMFYEKDLCEKMYILIKNTLIIYVIIFTLLYFGGYCGLESYGYKINLVNQSEMIIRFNEKRINGFTSHKSSYALICYISILFTKVSNDSKLKKYIIYFIIELSILLSNSMMGIAVSLITLLLFILMDFQKINKYIKIIIYSSIIPFIVLFGDKIYYYISKARDISTAGGRFYIWSSYIKLMLQNKLGIAKLTADKLIKSNEWDFYYYNAHNVFIEEFLERGIIGGVLFVAIFIFFALKFIKIKRIDLFMGIIGITLICNMDYAIAKESIFFFWYLIILLYSKVRNDFYYK